MARHTYTAGIDIGTHMTRVVVATINAETGSAEVVAVGQAPTTGMRLGYITNTDHVAESVRAAV
ncbi:MAG: cell division protein FtsA, partial [Patescibacteria group bacterium]